MTVEDIAQTCGLSRASVSAVLNGKRKVKDSTRARVLECIRQTGYQSGIISRALMAELSEMIVVLVPGAVGAFADMVFQSVNDILAPEGYHVLLHLVRSENEDDPESLRSLEEYRPGGYLLFRGAEGHDGQIVKRIKEAGVPYVIVGGIYDLVESHCVGIDERRAMEVATDYAIEMGHRRLAYLCGSPFSSSSQERKMGFFASVVKNGLATENISFADTDTSSKSGYEAAMKVLTSGQPRPTAVLCFNDMVALGVYQAAFELSLKIPDDLSVVGFDGLDLVDRLGPPLTTVDIHPRQMGMRSAELLLKAIRKEISRGVMTDCLEPDIRIRKSVRRILG